MANERPESRCPDDALVMRARTDRESFGKLYDLYYDRIYRYCVRRLYRSSAAEEACSEVFLYVAANMRRFRGTTENEFRAWLYRIATNTINAHIRRGRRRGELTQQAVENGALSTASEHSTQTAADPLDWQRCCQAIGQLRLREQSIVTLRFFEELSHEEIAARLKLSPGAVRVALSRAIEKLRKQLMPEESPSNVVHKK